MLSNAFTKKVVLFVLPIALLLSLSACSSIPIFSMVKLSQLDPFKMDPNQIKIAVITHNALEVKKGDVTMSLGYAAADNSLIIEDVYLVEVSGPDFVDNALAKQVGDDERLTIMHLSEADAQQLRESQRLISQHQQSDEKGQGSFSVGINGSCVNNSLPEDELLVNIYLQPDSQTSYIKVIDDLDLYQQNGVKDLKNWPECAAH